MTGGTQQGSLREDLCYSESVYATKAKIKFVKVCKTNPVITFGL